MRFFAFMDWPERCVDSSVHIDHLITNLDLSCEFNGKARFGVLKFHRDLDLSYDDKLGSIVSSSSTTSYNNQTIPRYPVIP